MKILKKEDFSLIFMGVLAKNYSEKYIPISFIAKDTNLSPLFLKQIAMALKDKNLLESKEGITGGYRLSQPPERIFVADILGAISDGIGIITPHCFKGKCSIYKESCNCVPLWGMVNKQLYTMLKKISLFEFSNL